MPQSIMQQLNTYRSGPDERGHFGIYGGRFVAETLMPLILEVEQAYDAAKSDPPSQAELRAPADALRRPSQPARTSRERLTAHLGGAKIYFKRDELNHTGAHKINNCIGQILLARRMGKTRIIAETGAGQHGVATATVCALFGLPCVDLHGRDRRRAAEAQRLPHEAAGRRGRCRSTSGSAHPQGRHERGDARLGHQRRRHLSTSSAPPPARTPIRRWSATSSA